MTVKLTYRKPPLSTAEQVKKLQSRGLTIADPKEAEVFFSHNSYYRFSAYTYVFEDPPKVSNKRSHTFHTTTTTFEQIKRYYIFDHKLRELTSHALRHVEVGVRTKICLELAMVYADGHFYLNPTHFKSAEAHNGFLSKCYSEARRSQETFIKHYREKYETPELPPLWMMIEILTFGQVSMFFSNLTAANQKRVSSTFDLSPDRLASWLASLSYTRNLCAHHSRLWNRKFTKKPQGSKKLPVTESGSYAQAASVTKYLLDKAEPNFPFATKLRVLLNDYPEIDPAKLGFRQKGLTDSFWDD